MNRKQAIAVLAAALILALVASMSLAQGPQFSLAQEEPGAEAPPAPAGLVPGTLSYQGRLLDDSGDPVDGARTMTFRLYTEETGGTALWSQTLNDVPLDDGLFHVTLDVDTALFDGQALWLGVQVQGDAQEMAPRQPMLPAPYALSLRPGALIRGALGETPTLAIEGDESGVRAEVASSEPWHAAILGANAGPGNGVSGYSSAGSGVYGQSTDGYGVLGVSTNEVAVYGKSVNSAGFFTSTLSTGVHGETGSDDPMVAAVEGMNLGGGKGVAGYSSQDAGVYGQSTNGAGVYGQSTDDAGVFGYSTDGEALSGYSPNWIAVYGKGYEGGSFTAEGVGTGVRGVSVGGLGGSFVSGTGAAASFVSTLGPAILVEGAGQEGLRIMDPVGGDYILAGSDEDFDFKVSNIGDVFADGSYHCGQGPGAEPGACIIQNSPADLAEMLPASESLEPGDVLVIGPDGRLARSRQAYQPTVVGTYSTQPGYLGGGEFRGRDDYAPLAITGIVPVKVTAENGPIRPGDLLVASGMPGHAMAAGPNAPVGTVIGKALRALDRGTGVILMLAMLQ